MAAIFSDAVRRFWSIRDEQGQRNLSGARRDQGRRSEATGGKQFGGFSETLIAIAKAAGVEDAILARHGGLGPVLPGYYRETKSWDLVIATEERLHAVIEFKAQLGPSFGNNFNNRIEEAIGNAADFWLSYREEFVPTSPQPWLGFVLVIELTPRSTAGVRSKKGLFPSDSVFTNESYIGRYAIALRRLVRERQYQGACLLTVNRDWLGDETPYREPAPELSGDQFVAEFIRAVRP